jgi:hypothetical protein
MTTETVRLDTNYTYSNIPEDEQSFLIPIELIQGALESSGSTSFEIELESPKLSFKETLYFFLSCICSMFCLNFLYDSFCNFIKSLVPEVALSQNKEVSAEVKHKNDLILKLVESHYDGNVYSAFTSKASSFRSGTQPTCDLTPERLGETYKIIKELESQSAPLNARDQQIMQPLKEFILRNRELLNIVE